MTENMKLFEVYRMTGFFLGLKCYIPSFLDSHSITYSFMADIPLRTAVWLMKLTDIHFRITILFHLWKNPAYITLMLQEQAEGKFKFCHL